MKCNACKRKMESVISDFDVEINNQKFSFLNVPAYKCTECGKIVIDDIVKENMSRFANDSKSNFIDYSQKEEEELAVTTVLLKTLNFF